MARRNYGYAGLLALLFFGVFYAGYTSLSVAGPAPGSSGSSVFILFFALIAIGYFFLTRKGKR